MIRCSEFSDVNWLKTLLAILTKPTDNGKNHIPLTWQENYVATKTILAYYIIIYKFEETDTTYSTITNEIISYLYGPHYQMKRFFLEFLICLNQKHLSYNRRDQTMVNIVSIISIMMQDLSCFIIYIPLLFFFHHKCSLYERT